VLLYQRRRICNYALVSSVMDYPH